MQAGNREQAEGLRAQVKQINEQLEQVEAKLAPVQEEVTKLQWLVPNIVSPDTPIGLSDADNVELDVWERCQRSSITQRSRGTWGVA